MIRKQGTDKNPPLLTQECDLSKFCARRCNRLRFDRLKKSQGSKELCVGLGVSITPFCGKHDCARKFDCKFDNSEAILRIVSESSMRKLNGHLHCPWYALKPNLFSDPFVSNALEKNQLLVQLLAKYLLNYNLPLKCSRTAFVH